MKYIAQNFSLNMVDTTEDYTLNVKQLDRTTFLKEIHDAENRLNNMEICQELNLFPNKGNISATIGDVIYVAQFFYGELHFRKVLIKSNMEDIQW